MHSLIVKCFLKERYKMGHIAGFIYIITYFATLKSIYFLIGPKYQPNPVSLVYF